MMSAGASSNHAAPTNAAGFAGRLRELAALRSALASVESGQGRLVLLTGEPGIGKTRLLQELTVRAAAHGMGVVWGRAYEGNWPPPYGLWREALEECATVLDAYHMSGEVSAASAALGRLLPPLQAISTLAPAASLSSGDGRFRLYDAVMRLLLAVTRERPLLLVLDDLHWADPDSLGLLQYVARFLRHHRLLIAGAYRDVEMAAGHPLAAALDVVGHEPGYERLQLCGLSGAEVEEYLALSGDRDLSTEFARALHAETDGNPFFLGELLRHLVEEGRLADDGRSWSFTSGTRPPESVRQIVGRRLARLSANTNRVLTSAAAFSGGFAFPVLQRLTDLPEEALLDCIDEALSALLIRPQGAHAERYDFAHVIVRHTLYDALNPSRRVRLHRRIAEVLADVYPDHLDAHAAEIAVQYHASAELAGAEHGISHALVAADRARAGYAHEQAVTFLRMARDLAAERGSDEHARILGRLAVAEAEALLLDDAARTVERTLGALQESGATRREQADFLGRAIAALRDGGTARAVWKPLLERGMDLTEGTRDLTWVRLAIQIDPVEPLTVCPFPAGRWTGLDARAVVIARSEGDEEDYARTLWHYDCRTLNETRETIELARTWAQPRAITWAMGIAGIELVIGHGAFREGVALCQELQLLAERFGSIPSQSEALVNLTKALTELGEFAAAREAQARAEAAVRRMGHDYQRLQISSAGMEAGLGYYLGANWQNLAQIWGEGTGALDAAGDPLALVSVARAAMVQAQAGRVIEACRLLENLTPVLEQANPSTWCHHGAVTLAATAVWNLELVQFAAAYRRLAHELVSVGAGSYPGTSNELTVARMAALLKETDAARHWFVVARAALDEAGRRPLRAIVDYDEALALSRSPTCDRTALQLLLKSALAQFQSLNMGVWVDRVLELRQRAGLKGDETVRRGPAFPDGLTLREVEILRLLAAGSSNTAIAGALVISPRTVERHVANIYAKAGIHSRRAAHGYALRHRLIAASA